MRVRRKRALLVVGSTRPQGASTSKSLGCSLLDRLLDGGVAARMLFVSPAGDDRHTASLLTAVDAADLFILSSPEDVEGLPHLVVRALERISARRRRQPSPRPCRFLAILNGGFPEADESALETCRVFSQKARFEWAGGVALGGGEAVHGQRWAEVGRMGRHVTRALDLAAEPLLSESVVPEREMMATPSIPPPVYTLAARVGWMLRAPGHLVLTELGAVSFENRP